MIHLPFSTISPDFASNPVRATLQTVFAISMYTPLTKNRLINFTRDHSENINPSIFSLIACPISYAMLASLPPYIEIVYTMLPVFKTVAPGWRSEYLSPQPTIAYVFTRKL